MSAADFSLPAELELLLQAVCAEQHVPARQHDEIRALVSTPARDWPVCCGGSCTPCVEDPKSIAREVLTRFALRATP